jgi:hypothetical protein
VDDALLGDILALDMACMESKVGIEFNGPSHYVTRTDSSSSAGRGSVAARGEEGEEEEDGSTAFKARVLRAAGWRLVSVPYRDWMVLGSERERDDYLRRRMAEVGVALLPGEEAA